MQHGPAPDHRLVSGIQQPHRNHFDPVLLNRLYAVSFQRLRLRVERAEHERNVRTVDVSIQQADFVAELGKSDCEIHRDGGLSYSTLSRADSDDVLDAGQRLRSRRDPMRMSVSQNDFLSLDYSDYPSLAATFRTCPSDN
jgi:hypothetical protein